MSIENAILELASAIRELAGASSGRTKVDAAEVEQAVQKIENAAGKTPAQKAVADALEAAEEAKTKKPKAEPKAEPKVEEPEEEAPALDYDKDVAPALTAYAKAQGRDKLVALMSKFGAKNGAGIKVADYAAVLADIAADDLV